VIMTLKPTDRQARYVLGGSLLRRRVAKLMAVTVLLSASLCFSLAGSANAASGYTYEAGGTGFLGPATGLLDSGHDQIIAGNFMITSSNDPTASFLNVGDQDAIGNANDPVFKATNLLTGRSRTNVYACSTFGWDVGFPDGVATSIGKWLYAIADVVPASLPGPGGAGNAYLKPTSGVSTTLCDTLGARYSGGGLQRIPTGRWFNTTSQLGLPNGDHIETWLVRTDNLGATWKIVGTELTPSWDSTDGTVFNSGVGTDTNSPPLLSLAASTDIVYVGGWNSRTGALGGPEVATFNQATNKFTVSPRGTAPDAVAPTRPPRHGLLLQGWRAYSHDLTWSWWAPQGFAPASYGGQLSAIQNATTTGAMMQWNVGARVVRRTHVRNHSWVADSLPPLTQFVYQPASDPNKVTYCNEPKSAEAVGEAQLLLSDDGRTLWAMSAAAAVVKSVACHNSWAIAVQQRLLRSSNNGRTWTTVPAPVGVTFVVGFVNNQPVVCAEHGLFRLKGNRWIKVTKTNVLKDPMPNPRYET
jgi:hypothetical protein